MFVHGYLLLGVVSVVVAVRGDLLSSGVEGGDRGGEGVGVGGEQGELVFCHLEEEGSGGYQVLERVHLGIVLVVLLLLMLERYLMV